MLIIVLNICKIINGNKYVKVIMFENNILLPCTPAEEIPYTV